MAYVIPGAGGGAGAAPAPVAAAYGAYGTPVTSPLVEFVEEKYKGGYALGMCTWLQAAAPDIFAREFGTIERCIETMSRAADVYFDAWKVKYFPAVIGRAKTVAAALERGLITST